MACSTGTIVKFVWCRFLILIAFVCAFTFESLAAVTNARYIAKPITIKVNNAVIKGYHYVNLNGRRNKGKPVLFLHGIALNLHEFDDMIEQRMAAGDDVYAFNWRGHGNGVERSYIPDEKYSEGDYGFDKMVSEDFPAIVKYVTKNRGEPISIIGHSMGGMITLAALGLGEADGKIRSVVALATPAQVLGRINPENMWWRNYIAGLLNVGPGNAPINVLVGLDAARLFNMFNPFYKPFEKMFMRYVAAPQLESFGVEDNFEGGFETWADYMVSRQVPADIYRSFDRFGRPHQGFKYTGLKVKVPVLHIVASRDRLARREHILRIARTQAADPGHWIIDIQGASHLDIVAGPVARMYTSTIHKFLIDPWSLGPANKTRFRMKVGTTPDSTCEFLAEIATGQD